MVTLFVSDASPATMRHGKGRLRSQEALVVAVRRAMGAATDSIRESPTRSRPTNRSGPLSKRESRP